MRKEHDFLGELEVADELYYGVQTIFYTIYYFINNSFYNYFCIVKDLSLTFIGLIITRPIVQ